MTGSRLALLALLPVLRQLHHNPGPMLWAWNGPWSWLANGLALAAAIFLAGNMEKKRTVAVSEGTLSTDNAMFVGLLIGIILIVGALSFLPALALGPIADYFSSL